MFGNKYTHKLCTINKSWGKQISAFLAVIRNSVPRRRLWLSCPACTCETCLSEKSAVHMEGCSLISVSGWLQLSFPFDDYRCYWCFICVIIIHADVQCESVHSWPYVFHLCVLCSCAQHLERNSADPWCFLVGRGTTQRCMCWGTWMA